MKGQLFVLTRSDAAFGSVHTLWRSEVKFILANFSGSLRQPESWDTWSDIRLLPDGATGFVLS